MIIKSLPEELSDKSIIRRAAILSNLFIPSVVLFNMKGIKLASVGVKFNYGLAYSGEIGYASNGVYLHLKFIKSKI